MKKQPNKYELIGEYYNNDLFVNSPIPIAIVDSDGTFIKVNQKWCKFLEYDNSEVEMLLKFQDITHPADLIADVALAKQVADDGVDHYQMTKRYITKSGKIVWLKLFVQNIKNQDGIHLFYISSAMPFENKKELIVKSKEIKISSLELIRTYSIFFGLAIVGMFLSLVTFLRVFNLI